MIIFGVEKQSRPSSGDHPLLPPHVHMHTAKPPAFHRTMIIFRGACHVPNDISDCPMHPSYICMLAWQPLVGHTHCSGCVRGAAEDKDLRNSSRRQNAPVVRCHFVAVHCVWAGVLYLSKCTYCIFHKVHDVMSCMAFYCGWVDLIAKPSCPGLSRKQGEHLTRPSQVEPTKMKWMWTKCKTCQGGRYHMANVLYLGWSYSKAFRDSARGGIWQDDQK